MNSSLSTPAPPVAPERPISPVASTLGQRIWKGFGGTPWWRLILGGLIVLIAVGFFTLPFDETSIVVALGLGPAIVTIPFIIAGLPLLTGR